MKFLDQYLPMPNLKRTNHDLLNLVCNTKQAEELPSVEKAEKSALEVLNYIEVTNFTDLPDVALNSIFSIGNLYSIGVVANVCKLFNQIISMDFFWKTAVNFGLVEHPKVIPEGIIYKDYVKQECMVNWKFSKEETFCLKNLGMFYKEVNMDPIYEYLTARFITVCKEIGSSDFSCPGHITFIETYIKKDSDFRILLDTLKIKEKMEMTTPKENNEKEIQIFTGAELFAIGNHLLHKLENKLKRIAENNPP